MTSPTPLQEGSGEVIDTGKVIDTENVIDTGEVIDTGNDYASPLPDPKGLMVRGC